MLLIPVGCKKTPSPQITLDLWTENQAKHTENNNNDALWSRATPCGGQKRYTRSLWGDTVRPAGHTWWWEYQRFPKPLLYKYLASFWKHWQDLTGVRSARRGVRGSWVWRGSRKLTAPTSTSPLPRKCQSWQETKHLPGMKIDTSRPFLAADNCPG